MEFYSAKYVIESYFSNCFEYLEEVETYSEWQVSARSFL